MAARRERERRRPAERRYQFTSPEPALEPEEEALLEEDGAVAETVTGQADQTQARAARAARPATSGPAASNRASARTAPAPKPFTAYRDEYAYVYGDLRRVAAVIGGLLVALIVLYFVLPTLAR